MEEKVAKLAGSKTGMVVLVQSFKYVPPTVLERIGDQPKRKVDLELPLLL
jgi:hypothetical protein